LGVGTDGPRFDTNDLNGEPILNFVDGGADANIISAITMADFPTDAFTVYMVAKLQDEVQTHDYWGSDGSTPGHLHVVKHFSEELRVWDNAYQAEVVIPDPAAWHIIETKFDTVSGDYVNRVNEGTAVAEAGTERELGNFSLGDSVFGTSDGLYCAEFIVYEVVLSNEDAASIRSYLASRYGL
ncbi:hypothetical protein LCGC14_1910690, partial [marine sediment metagenome]